MSDWKSRIIGSGTEDPTQLVANPKNWRIHPKAQQDSLADVLERVGWVQQIIVNKVTGNVVDGHLRVELAISRNESSVPVVYVELDPSEEALILATLDPLASMAATDDAKLRELLAEVQVTDDLESLLRELAGSDIAEGHTNPDDAPQTPDDADVYVQPGDLWLLGTHRLLCGDSTNAEDVARLMDGEKADMLLTDPPYGLDRDLARAAGREWRIANDAPEVAGQMYAACEAFPAPERYVWGQWNTWRFLVDALGDPDNCIVWVKSNMGMGHGYRHKHEFLAYFGEKSFSDQSDVWESPRDYSGLHPTTKPVALLVRAVNNSSAKGALVADPFAGSGSTIIAAEQTGRRCYAMELEPKYVQVAKERWEAFTGKEAVLDGSSLEADA